MRFNLLVLAFGMHLAAIYQATPLPLAYRIYNAYISLMLFLSMFLLLVIHIPKTPGKTCPPETSGMCILDISRQTIHSGFQVPIVWYIDRKQITTYTLYVCYCNQYMANLRYLLGVWRTFILSLKRGFASLLHDLQ